MKSPEISGWDEVEQNSSHKKLVVNQITTGSHQWNLTKPLEISFQNRFVPFRIILPEKSVIGKFTCHPVLTSKYIRIPYLCPEGSNGPWAKQKEWNRRKNPQPNTIPGEPCLKVKLIGNRAGRPPVVNLKNIRTANNTLNQAPGLTKNPAKNCSNKFY